MVVLLLFIGPISHSIFKDIQIFAVNFISIIIDYLDLFKPCFVFNFFFKNTAWKIFFL